MDKKLLLNRKTKQCAVCKKPTQPEVYMRVWQYLEANADEKRKLNYQVRLKRGYFSPSSRDSAAFTFSKSVQTTGNYYNYNARHHYWVICGSCCWAFKGD